MSGYRQAPSFVTVNVSRHLAELELRGLSPNTIYARGRALARMRQAIGRPRLVDATAEDLLEWRRSLTVGPDATVCYVSHARGFYGWAVRSGVIGEDPTVALLVPRLPRRLPRPIAEADLMAALAGAPARIRPWLVLAGWCGLRAREIALLRRENVLETGDRPLVRIAADATKGSRERTVPLSPFVLGELHRHGLPPSGWIFRRYDHGGGPNQSWLVSHLANTYLHECGIAATLHQLRHRFGTQLYRQTKDLRLVQELLGHAWPNTTAGYAAYDAEAAVAAVAALRTPGQSSG